MISEASVLMAIDVAFKDTVCPDANSLVVGDYFEKLEIRDFLLNRQWHDIDVDMLDAYDARADLSVTPLYLSPRAVVYFMPAFLKYVVSKGRSNGLLLRVLLSQFKKGNEPFDPTCYNGEQRGAITQVLAYLEQLYKDHDKYDFDLVRECREAWIDKLAKL